MAMLPPIYEPNLPQEEWRDVDVAPDYQVSNAGRLRSKSRADTLGRPRRGRMVKTPANGDGYPSTTLKRCGKKVRVKVHVLVARAFLGPRPLGHHCCHNNGNPADNRLENLRYDTELNNNRDRLRHGTVPRGEAVHGARLTEEIVRGMLALKGELTLSEIAERFGSNISTVGSITLGRRWRHVYDTTDAATRANLPPGAGTRLAKRLRHLGQASTVSL